MRRAAFNFFSPFRVNLQKTPKTPGRLQKRKQSLFHLDAVKLSVHAAVTGGSRRRIRCNVTLGSTEVTMEKRERKKKSGPRQLNSPGMSQACGDLGGAGKRQRGASAFSHGPAQAAGQTVRPEGATGSPAQHPSAPTPGLGSLAACHSF